MTVWVAVVDLTENTAMATSSLNATAHAPSFGSVGAAPSARPQLRVMLVGRGGLSVSFPISGLSISPSTKLWVPDMMYDVSGTALRTEYSRVLSVQHVELPL